MIYGITLILLSLLAVPSLILSRKPNAKELLDKIAPFQGWIGFIFCIWGLWGIFTSLLNIGWMSLMPVWWLTLLAGSIVQAVLGFMLGYSLISKWIFTSESAQQKGERIRGRLAPLQGKFGVAGIFLGGWVILAHFMFFVG